MDKDKCPYCGAETRPGDNFCLNCGNRLLSTTPSASSQQAQPVGEATIAAPEDWAAQGAVAAPSVPLSNGWGAGSSSGAEVNGWGAGSADANSWGADSGGNADATIGENVLPEHIYSSPTAQSQSDRIEQPARFILRADDGNVLQEYPLDKLEITIGRAPTSDILLSKDKLTSRRHATVRYENGQYVLRDERSANGTFVNGQTIEEVVPVELKDGDHVGIGEHELVFHVFGSVLEHVEDLPTMAVPYEPPTFRTQDDDQRTVTSDDDYSTSAVADEGDIQRPQVVEMPEVVQSSASNGAFPGNIPPSSVPNIPIPEPVSYASAPVASPVFQIPPTPSVAPVYAPVFSNNVPSTMESASVTSSNTPSSTAGSDAGVHFGRLTSLSQPALPDMSALMAALSTLDGQVMSLQEQLNATQEALRVHDAELAQTSGQLRAGVRRVSERMDNTIADVARSREALAWAELLQLMEDVMNNPRDIEYVTKLARKARELNKVFQLHQSVLNTMAECNSLLRSMISDDSR